MENFNRKGVVWIMGNWAQICDHQLSWGPEESPGKKLRPDSAAGD